MRKIYLNDLKQKELNVHPANIGYYKIFSHLILPYVLKDDIEFWTRIQCTQLIHAEKENQNTYLFFDKFFVLDYCLTTAIKYSNPDKTQLYFNFIKKLTESQIKSYAFNEIIFFISRYKAILNLFECHQELKKQLPKEECLELFNNSNLTIGVFIKLIKSSEASYNNSRKKTPSKESCNDQ